MSNRLLCLSYRFPPETYALAVRVKYVLNHLADRGWEIDAITAAPDAATRENVTVHHVPSRTPERLFQALRDLYLGKLLDLLIWPDPYVFWVLPAYWTARRLARRNEYDAVLVFMMPYSQGLAGLLLKRDTGLPLILNLNDSPTCSDMNPWHPSRLHYTLSEALEDRFVRAADAVVYVSKHNLERVRRRQPPEHRDHFHLIRRGTKPLPSPRHSPRERSDFRIRYVGGTSGWYRFLETDRSASWPRRLYRAWTRLGRHVRADLDFKTHGPVYVGRAVRQILDRRPEWRGRLHVDVYGKRYPKPVTDAVLDKFGLRDIVHLHGRVPHDEALRHMVESDLLFMALPDRPDGSPGGRISAKTYEYLMTDRPILAALPPGENRAYLRDKPGVYLTRPDDSDEMAEVITRLASAKFADTKIAVDRSDLRPSLSSTARARAFERIVSDVTTAPTPSTSLQE
jgi:glycosyltransferase involved in cell wall biosynthesis